MPANPLPPLVAGPYQPPCLPIGSRTTCLLHDCDGVITSWSDAPISWPRCRALESRGGGSGLLLDEEELARAVRSESALAIKAWWGVTAGVVWRWRKVLEVTLTSNPESLRLLQASSRKGAARMKTRSWSPEERETRRRLNQELQLARHLKPGFNGPNRWTPDEDAAVRKLSAAEAVRKTGRSLVAVYRRRKKLKLPDGRRR